MNTIAPVPLRKAPHIPNAEIPTSDSDKRCQNNSASPTACVSTNDAPSRTHASNSSNSVNHCNLDPAEFSVCGYLSKLSSQQKSKSQFFITTSKSLVRKRWMVLSERACKLFYYKSKGDVDAMGEINISSATFNYDPEEPDGLFTIM